MSKHDRDPSTSPVFAEFEDLYENAPCGHLSMKPDGRILRVNATLARWLGYAPQQLMGKRLHDFLAMSSRILYETSFAPMLNMQGSVDEISMDLIASDSRTLAVSGSGKVVPKDAEEKPSEIRLAFFKANDRRRYERQIVDANEKSQSLKRATQTLLDAERQTSDLREQFIAVLGHDLRNPLASLSGGLRLLQRDQPAERRKYIFDMLEGSIVRMSGLIDNVLDFARGRLGAGIPLELRQDVLLTPILEQVASELRVGMSDRKIETDFDLPTPVKCDPSRIGQLVSNLLGNALTHGSPDAPIRFHADSGGGMLTIWIANAGAPIPPAAMDRLFQPFFRGEVRNSLQGLGLGLHIASEIAKAHGGAITVASSPEETRFTFRMAL